MPVTRADVAREAGVSPAVVSYVLNDGPRPVSPSTRARVEQAIAKLGYRPNAIAAALRAGSTRSIGFLTPDPRDHFLAELGEAVERQFSAQDYLVLVGTTSYDRSREERHLRSFLDRNVDAVIFGPGVSLAASPPPIERPVLSLDGAPPADGWSSVQPDDRTDAATATEHLQRHGHTLIGCVAGPPQLAAEADRIAGWRTRMDCAGLPAGSELLSYGDISEDGGYTATLQLLSEHGRPWAIHGRRPSAVLVTSDVQAVGVISACHELGLAVPDDVAVVSMDGTRIAAYTIPPLTTMRQDVEYIAQLVVQDLLDRLQRHQSPTTVRLTGNLVLGRSCGCSPTG